MGYGRGRNNRASAQGDDRQAILPDNADSRPANPANHRGGHYASRGRGRGGRGGYTGRHNTATRRQTGEGQSSEQAEGRIANAGIKSLLNPESKVWEPPTTVVAQSPTDDVVEQSQRTVEATTGQGASLQGGAFLASPYAGHATGLQESFSSSSSQSGQHVSSLSTHSETDTPTVIHAVPYNSPVHGYSQAPRAHNVQSSEFIGGVSSRNANHGAPLVGHTKARANTIGTVGGENRAFNQLTFDLLNDTLQRTDRQHAGAH